VYALYVGLLLTKYYSGDQSMNNNKGGECGTNGGGKEK
jgi:hypothetical protein